MRCSSGSESASPGANLADDAVKKPSAQIESTVSNPKNVMSGHHDAPASPPFQHIQQIVAEAGLCSSAGVQLSVNCQSHLGRIDIRWQLELGVSGIIAASAAL